jgi:hypothetical protein
MQRGCLQAPGAEWRGSASPRSCVRPQWRCMAPPAMYGPRGAVRLMKCALCEGTSWVCENHPDTQWDGEHACRCGAAGMPVREVQSERSRPPAPAASRHADRVRQEGLAALNNRPHAAGNGEFGCGTSRERKDLSIIGQVLSAPNKPRPASALCCLSDRRIWINRSE